MVIIIYLFILLLENLTYILCNGTQEVLRRKWTKTKKFDLRFFGQNVPCEQWFFSSMAFSIYEVVRIALSVM